MNVEMSAFYVLQINQVLYKSNNCTALPLDKKMLMLGMYNGRFNNQSLS